MRVLLDEKPCPVEASCAGEAILAASALAEQDGRMIVAVSVDGRKWADAELADLPADRTSAAEVRLTTAEPRALVLEALAGAGEALRDADVRQRRAAELLESDRGVEAMEALAGALANWTDVERTISLGAEALGLDLADLQSGPGGIEGGIEALRERLGRVRDALRRDDPAGLADTLLYDLPDVIGQWQTLVDDLRRTIEAGGRA